MVVLGRKIGIDMMEVKEASIAIVKRVTAGNPTMRHLSNRTGSTWHASQKWGVRLCHQPTLGQRADVENRQGGTLLTVV